MSAVTTARVPRVPVQAEGEGGPDQRKPDGEESRLLGQERFWISSRPARWRPTPGVSGWDAGSLVITCKD